MTGYFTGFFGECFSQGQGGGWVGGKGSTWK